MIRVRILVGASQTFYTSTIRTSYEPTTSISRTSCVTHDSLWGARHWRDTNCSRYLDFRVYDSKPQHDQQQCWTACMESVLRHHGMMVNRDMLTYKTKEHVLETCSRTLTARAQIILDKPFMYIQNIMWLIPNLCWKKLWTTVQWSPVPSSTQSYWQGYSSNTVKCLMQPCTIHGKVPRPWAVENMQTWICSKLQSQVLGSFIYHNKLSQAMSLEDKVNRRDLLKA